MEPTNETIVLDSLIYSYVNNNGVQLFSPNPGLAHARAEFYQTFDVFVHKTENV